MKMASRPATEFGVFAPQELLGPLNEVEQKNAPELLFTRGDTSLVREGARVSVIGARRPSPEGLRQAHLLATDLARGGVIVVSGLANGIDTAAHMGALDVGGRTIAVLGTPLGESYPRQNRKLQRRIMTEHLAISPFPSGSSVRRRNFPLRNRVMALISDATIIVEAGDASGSLSQGWEAIRLGRLLFIPKSIVSSAHLAWPLRMLRYGAQVLTDTGSVFSLMPMGAAPNSSAVPF